MSAPPAHHAAAKAALAAAEARFASTNPLSKAQHELAISSLPGGNTRTLLHTPPFPLTISRGEGTHLYDLDGHKYLDLAGDMSAGLLGHTPLPPIRTALLTALDTIGLSLGGTTTAEARHASAICARFGLDRIRFANSGTEANLYALAAARKFTSRRKVVVFAGGYHGGLLSFPGREAAGNVVDREDFVVGLAKTDGVAAVLMEAVQGAGGVIPGRKEFLLAVREAAREVGAVFILDEVMTSRLAPGGLGRELGLEPDMVTLGKYLGGGFAFGAFGGREEIMAVYDPRREGAMGHSGTFNNNTMAMHAGRAALEEVFTPEVCVEFNQRGDVLRGRLVAAAKGTRMAFTGRGSLIGVHCTEDGMEEILSGGDVEGKERRDLNDLFWFEMLEEGFWIARRGYMALILQTTDEEMDRFVAAVVRFLERHRDIFVI
ncbi:pyridoxal phosphate-dependent transferase [Cercophora newfieldiana]|uniref:Pyridoxal phosphate-dependent transferase n=1 Tax=Cercophora newfieldiana TaxID=92897 RepID=A0AA39YC40_9PEZI|nr:pyridoxal phosphate-dependent transferase [Cercophora newfieldiana]